MRVTGGMNQSHLMRHLRLLPPRSNYGEERLAMFYTISQKNTEDERAQAIRGVFLMAVFMAVFRPGKRGNDSTKSAPTQ